MEKQEKVQVCERKKRGKQNCGNEKNKQAIIEELKEEADEEPIKVGWTHGENGRGRLTKRADALRMEERRRHDD